MKKTKLSAVLLTLLLPMVAFAQQANPISDMIVRVANFLSVVLIAFGGLFIVISGFYFIFAKGEESKLSAARSMLLWSVLGVVVGLLAPYLVNLAISFVPR